MALAVAVPAVVVFSLAFIALCRRSQTGHIETRDVLLGVIGTTLTLLPIRQVLVPADLQGLTLVDWWLGGFVLLLVAVALWVGSRIVE